jgi:alpha-galactosidase/6-phospho-beta-glucosidase family protein
VTRETDVKCVGLCHEIAGAQYALSNLLDAEFRDFDFDVVGVNHLPVITALRIKGDDAFPRLQELLGDPELQQAPIHLPAGIDPAIAKMAASFTKADLLEQHKVKFALFERFGALPGAGDRHLVEFFPNFLTEESGWGKRWGVALTTIADREGDAGTYRDELRRLRELTEVPTTPSGEMVAPLIDSFLRDKPRSFPLNLPNIGQVPSSWKRCAWPTGRDCAAATRRTRRSRWPNGCAGCQQCKSSRSKLRCSAIATRWSRPCCSTRWRGASTSTGSSN